MLDLAIVVYVTLETAADTEPSGFHVDTIGTVIFAIYVYKYDSVKKFFWKTFIEHVFKIDFQKPKTPYFNKSFSKILKIERESKLSRYTDDVSVYL